MLRCVSTFKQLIWRSRRRVPKFMILCENDNFKAWCYCWWILDYIKCLQEPKMNVDCSGSSTFSGSSSWPCLMSPGLSTSISTSWRDSSSTWPPSASSWPPSSSKSSPLHQATRKNLHQTNPCAVKTTNSNKVIKVVFMVSNVLYNIQQHEIKWGIYRSQCSVYLFTTLMTSSRTSRKWTVSEGIIWTTVADSQGALPSYVHQ